MKALYTHTGTPEEILENPQNEADFEEGIQKVWKKIQNYDIILTSDDEINLQQWDDVIRLSGAMAIHFYQEQKDLEREIKEIRGSMHSSYTFYYLIKKILKRVKEKLKRK